MTFDQYRTYCIIDDRYQNYRYNCIDKGCRRTHFCKCLCQFLWLSQNVLFVEISYDRICNYVKCKSCDRCDHTPFENIFFICTLIDLCNLVCHKTYDQTDTEFQYKGFRCACDINRVHDICNSHSDSSGKSAIYATQKQCCKYAESISNMNGCCVSTRHRDLDLQKCEGYIT